MVWEVYCSFDLGRMGSFCAYVMSRVMLVLAGGSRGVYKSKGL